MEPAGCKGLALAWAVEQLLGRTVAEIEQVALARAGVRMPGCTRPPGRPRRS
jgi:hypothetical protein